MFLAQKIGFRYQSISDLLKKYWKLTRINKDIMSNLLAQLQPHIIDSKKKLRHCANTLFIIKKYWNNTLYKWFYQIDKVIRLGKFFR